jgi:hypothetical protein
MFNKLFMLSAVAIAMAGCASTKETPVVQRNPGSFTSLTFPVFSDKWENGKVQMATNNKRGCGEFANNILPATFEKDFTLDIEGGRDLFFHISRTEHNLVCNEVGLFYATKGNEYTLSLNITNQQCVVSLLEKTPSGRQNKINTYPAYTSAVGGAKVCINKDSLY